MGGTHGRRGAEERAKTQGEGVGVRLRKAEGGEDAATS